MVNPKHAFWQALVLAIVVFGIGLLLGFFLENSRISYVSDKAFASENVLLDQQLRDLTSGQLNISCDVSVQGLFSFADSVYEDANQLEEYDAASKFTTQSLRAIHQRYDLLRVMLWIEADKTRQRCKSDFHTVVYFYDYASGDIDREAEQATLSRLLLDLKYSAPEKILLIPVARNLDLETVSLIEDHYNLPSGPIILIDGKRVISSLPTFAELNNSVFNQAP